MQIKLKHAFFYRKKKYLELIMKTFLFLFCTTVFSFSSNNILSQNADIVVGNDKIISVDEVFDIIRKQTNYTFVYHKDLFESAPPVQLKKGIIKANTLLKKALSFDKFSLEFLKKGIIQLKKKDKNTEVSVIDQEKIVITGLVTDESGEPLVGVNVVSLKLAENKDISIKGTSTDFDGKYKITTAIGEELQFSYVGYIAQSIKVEVNTKKNLNIVLKEDINQLEEVVVSTGYQKLSKERTTGAFGKINTDKLDQRPIADIADRLEGTVAGLNLVVDPATNKRKIRIRGASTLNGDSNVLIVVDNFPIEGDLSTINPQDIESITVLKDATASSIWGVRASNGVVVITTKKGKKGKLNIDFSNYISVTEKIDYSKMNYLSTSDQIDMALEYYNKGWFGPSFFISRRNPISVLDEGYLKLQGNSPTGEIWSQARFNSYTNELKTRSTQKQWEKYLLRNPLRKTYNLSISGGAENNSFYSSLIYNDNSFASIGDSSDEIILNIKNVYNYNEKLTLNAGVNVLFNETKDNGVEPTAITQTRPFEDLVDKNGNLNQYYTTRDPWTSKQREAIDGVGSYGFNQLEEQRNTDKTNQRFSVRATIGAEYKATDDLKISSNFQYERGSYDVDQFNSMNLPSHRIQVNEFTVNGVNHIPLGTEYAYSRQDFNSWNFRNTLTWDKNWEDHKLNVFAGTEIIKNSRNEFSNRVFGYDRQARVSIPVNQTAFSNFGTPNWAGDSWLDYEFYKDRGEEERVFSMFSNVGYQYLNKYTVNASFRIDQKNLFGSDPKYRYKPLWSVGLGWDITKEDFMSDVSYLDNLKLRATYGFGGNADSRFSPFAQAQNNLNIIGGNTFNYLTYIKAGNEQLRWEETGVFNLALDFSLFNRRLSGSLEYYAKKSSDLLGSIDIDPTVGFSNGTVNYASMTNKGFELELNGVIINKENFKWRSNLNFNYNDNKVVEIRRVRDANNVLDNGQVAKEIELGAIYAIDYAGLSNTGEILLREPDGTIKTWRQKDYFSFPTDELLRMGPSEAPYYGGFSNTFSYKGLDLTFNLVYKFGHKFRRNVGSLFDGYSGVTSDGIWANRWQKPGDELTTRVPGIAYNGVNPYSGQTESLFDHFSNQNFYQYAKDHVYDAAFVRVRDIVLGYSLPQEFLGKTFIKGIKISGQFTNPFIWVANKPGLDPEAHSRMAYDNLKTFTFGVKANF